MFRRLVLSLIATRNCSRVTKHVVSLKPSIISGSFHIDPSYSSNCDFGSPCNCTEYRGDAKRLHCDVCKVRPAANQSSELSRDRKSISSYTFTSFCEQCFERYIEGKRKREREKEQTLASREKRMDKMMNYVRELHSTEQVPIGYAVEKLQSDIRSVNTRNSQRWYQRHLVDCLAQDLQIVKVWNRYMCNKRRVDSMDFRLWLFYRQPDIDV